MRNAPLLTVAAVAGLGVALLVANMVNDPARQREAAAAAPVVVAAPAAAQAAPPPAVEAEPPAEPPAVAEKAYAGRSSGNEVTVAIAVKDGRAVAYVCDGEKIEGWLEGTLEGDRLSLTGADEASITGTVADAAALGTVAVKGKQWPFAAKGVDAPAGLYEGRADVRGVATRIGWIVEDDGRVTGLRAVEGSDEPQPAPELDPTAPGNVMVDGTPVVVVAVDGATAVIER